jgi:hypothetical protein
VQSDCFCTHSLHPRRAMLNISFYPSSSSTVEYSILYKIYILIVCKLFMFTIIGVNFALFWSASVDAIALLTPGDLSNTCMATLNMIYFTLAGIVGNTFFGILFDYGGSVVTYYVSACVLMANLFLFILFQGKIIVI